MERTLHQRPAWRRMMDADSTALPSFMNDGYAPPDWEFQHALEAYSAAMRTHHPNGHSFSEPQEAIFRILHVAHEPAEQPGVDLHRWYGG